VVFRGCDVQGVVRVSEGDLVPTFTDSGSPTIRHELHMFNAIKEDTWKEISQNQKGRHPGQVDPKHGRICKSCTMNERQLPDRSFKKCAKCLSVYYCGRECQLANWKAHKPQCEINVTINPKMP